MSQQPQQQIIYQNVMKPATNGMAVASLVLGIIAIATGIWTIIPLIGLAAAFLSFLPALLAIIFGHTGLNRYKTIGVGKGQALTGLILGYTTIGITILTTTFWFIAMVASDTSTM